MNLSKYNSKDTIIKLTNDIVNARREGSLICVVGAGVSISQGYPNWNDYVQELIDYWSSSLKTITDNSDTLINRVDRNDVLFLRSLNDSSQSNKRKVDLVNFIVKKYCDTGNNRKTEELYKYYYLECEKFIFSEEEPLLHENLILNELVKLNSSFITTNYDEEIENSYRSILGRSPRVIPDAFSIEDNVAFNTVIHLHGLPSNNLSRVISSSKSYTDLYLKENRVRNSIKKIFLDKKNPVIIYVGCSMEEDEVLNLLQFNELNIQYYALMKYDDNGYIPEEIKFHNSVIQDYYIQEQNVNFIWYGNDYSDLPVFVSDLSKSVHDLEMSFLPNPDELEKVLLSGENKENFIKLLNEAIDSKSYYVIDSIFKKYKELPQEVEIRNIEYTAESLLFDNHTAIKPYFIEYWKCIEKIFPLLSSKFKEKIIYEIKSIGIVDNIHFIKIIFNIVSQYVDELSENRVSNLNEILDKMLNITYIDNEIQDQDIRCLWLSHQVNFTKNGYLYYRLSDDISFDFNQDTLHYFEKEMKDFQQNKKNASMSYLLEDTIVKNLSWLIKSGKITYDKQQIFPDSFYEIILVQRILISIDLENNLNSEILDRLIEKIDINNSYLGSNIIKFSEKHNLIPKDSFYYIDDDYVVTPMSIVKEQAFFNVQPIKNDQQVNDLVTKLREESVEKDIEIGDSFVNIGFTGQYGKLESVLNNKSQWENYRNQNIKFIENLINDEFLFENYFSVIVDMLYFALENEYDVQYISDLFLKKLSGNKQLAFTISNEDLFLKMIQKAQNDKNAKIYNFLFNIDPSDLEIPNILDNYNSFLNSKSGIYYYLVKEIEKKYKNVISDKNKLHLKNYIKEQKNYNYRCYLKGMFATEFEDDKEIITSSGFMGFSHNYRIYLGEKKWSEKYKNVVNELLKSEIDDFQAIINNVTVIMLTSLNPEYNQEVKKNKHMNSIKSSVFIQLIKFFLKQEDSGNYNASEWIEWFINNYSGTVNTAVSNLLRDLSNISIERGNQLINIINNVKITKDEKVNQYIFSYIPGIDEVNTEQLILIGNCIKTIFSRNLLLVNETVIIQISNILERLLDAGLKDNISKILNEAKNVISQDEMDKLMSEFC
ncbi:SIR2 family protein [Lentilactobacillus laojiaonis]|uniref:SIR2 family protein n=1 Tax=Lentilactobacillus laojiaonis TaxID=2883998 RepID=UPI001D0A087B|nr:SIR2 family protein [Lentilactobacillus laojiaonis]UDM32154.1 SIR2 family protein [Lentilactobacillus laojiaonis]